MRVSLIAAIGPDRVIGNNGDLPWRLPADLAHFKRTTLGHPVIMGRRTFDSIGKPLPKRQNIVITRSPEKLPAGVEGVTSADEALALCAGESDVFVIGGAEIYCLFLEAASRLIVTEVEGEFTGDTYFPAIDRELWREVERLRFEPDERNLYPYSFVTWERYAD